jgi:endonuclease/exonuclease/phosphatase family metal-dependent hydrolase
LSAVKETYTKLQQPVGWAWFARMKPSVHRLLRLPGLAALIPMARRVASVATPARFLSFRAHPAVLTSSECSTITVLSANLCHDWPRHRQLPQRLEAVARLIESEGVDVALLQEVTRTPKIRADEWLSDRLGMAYLYSRANGHESAVGFEEGLAIYSRFPLSMPSLTRLQPGSPFTHRLGLGARVETSCGHLQVFSVHLSMLPNQNAEQMSYLQNWISSIAGGHTTVIGGDFNTHEDSPQITQAQGSWVDTFRHLHPQADGFTHAFRWPWGGSWRRRRLDYLFLQPGNLRWRVLNAQHLDAPGGPHSDHRAVLTRLMLDA